MHVDLRSDTVTQPTAGMREVMMRAPVGDDVYGEDPSVAALQTEVAQILGKEAALFVPSGSMANQIAMQLLVGRGEELLAEADAHVVANEVGAAAAIGGISTRTWPSDKGRLDPAIVDQYIRRRVGYHTVATRAVAVENTHNRGGGTVILPPELNRLRDIADEAGVALHLDGARIWNAHVASGVPLAELVAPFDTVSVCLSKGLGAPVGSVVASTAERVELATMLRKRMGGGMRQAGMLAAAGSYALTHHMSLLAHDHARASRLAQALEPYGVTDAGSVNTNIVQLRVPDSAEFVREAKVDGVLVSAMDAGTVRVVTHLDVDDEQMDHAVAVMSKLLA